MRLFSIFVPVIWANFCTSASKAVSTSLKYSCRAITWSDWPLNWSADGVGSNVNDPDEADAASCHSPLCRSSRCWPPSCRVTAVPLVDAACWPPYPRPRSRSSPAASRRPRPVVPLAVVGCRGGCRLGALVAGRIRTPPHAARIAAAALAAMPPRKPRRERRSDRIPSSRHCHCSLHLSRAHPLHVPIPSCARSRKYRESTAMRAQSILYSHDSTVNDERHMRGIISN